MTERKVNDIGGLPAGPVCQDEHASTLHEKRVDAILKILSGPKLKAFTLDAMRRHLEQVLAAGSTQGIPYIRP